MNRRLISVMACMATAVLTGGCASHVAVPYPATPAGEALRHYYEAPMKEWPQTTQALGQIQDPATRQSLVPAILVILRQDDSVKAIGLGSMLSEWDPQLFTTAPEIRRLVPALGRALRRGNPEPRDKNMKDCPAIGGALLLGRLGPAAAYPARRDMYACFVAPVAKPIEGESDDCWTKAMVATLIQCYGEDGVPALMQGLSHKDPWVRVCALGALCGHGELGLPPGAQVAEKDFAWNTTAARAALPKVENCLWDENDSVRRMAVQAVGVLATPKTLSDKSRQRLMDMFIGKVGDERTRGSEGTAASEAMAALHPLFTAEMLTHFDALGDPFQGGAAHVLQKIGAPIMPEMIKRLPMDSSFSENTEGPMHAASWAHAVVREIGPRALPALAAAAKSGDAKTRKLAQDCVDEIATQARKIVNDRTDALAHPTPQMNDDIFVMDINDIRANAEVAEASLPVLAQIAQAHKNDRVRAAAEEAVKEIQVRKVELP